MEQMTAREQVLKAIRDAQVDGNINHITHDIDFELPIFAPLCDDEKNMNTLAIHFAKNMDQSEGYFIYCEDDTELVQSIKTVIYERNFAPIFTNDPKIELLFTKTDISYIHQPEDLEKARVVVSFCDCLIARYGSVLLTSSMPCGAVGNVFPDVRFIIAFSDQLVENISDSIKVLKEKYGNELPSIITYLTGPSRTNAIDLKPIIGVHGTRELYVFYLNNHIK